MKADTRNQVHLEGGCRIFHSSPTDSIPHLRISSEGYDAVVALRGATLLRWTSTADNTFDYVDGYVDRAELDMQDGVRSGITVPFPNRIQNACYGFNGKTYDLLPDAPDGASRIIYHGLVRLHDFTLVEAQTADGGKVLLRLVTHMRPDEHPGYPFALTIEVTYMFSNDGVDIAIVGTNNGEEAAPYAAGWHPYFKLPESLLEEWELSIPAKLAIMTDEHLIPLGGTFAYRDVEAQDLNFTQYRRIGDRAIDACFGDLQADEDGIVRTRLRHSSSPWTLVVWQETGYMHVFTGDTLARQPRNAIALEPVEAITDAFNRDDMRSAITLHPNQSRTFRFGFHLTPEVSG